MPDTLDPSAVKSRMKATWEVGDYATFATYWSRARWTCFWPGGSSLASGSSTSAVGRANWRSLRPGWGSRLPVSTSPPTWSPQRASERAKGEGLAAQFDEGDAEALAYEDASFDIVASIFAEHFGPMVRANAALDQGRREA